MSQVLPRTTLSQEHEHILRTGIQQLGLSVTDNQIGLLLDYLALFAKWNKAYNLSAVRDTRQMVSRHLLDSLAVVPFFQDSGSRLIDVGTGGGLPGMVLAIIFPRHQLTLLDSNGKKTRFLFQVKSELGLANVQVENRRVEQFQPDEKFDVVVSRAFASLKDMTEGCHHLLSPTGQFYAMKGIYPEDELSTLEKRYKVSSSHRLDIPGGEGERHLLVLTNSHSSER